MQKIEVCAAYRCLANCRLK